jgi:acetolactate synthase-1/2/3 large subunit
MNNADMVIMVGARVADRSISQPDLVMENKILAHIDVDPAEIGKNAGPTIPLVGDIKHVFEEFNKIDFKADYTDWIDQLDGYKDDARDAKRRRMYQREEAILNHQKPLDGINPVDFIRQLSLAMKEDAVYVADVGQNQMWSCSNYIARGGRFMTSGGMGTMGYSLPAAMGVKVGAPDRQVVAVCGDGGFQMTMQELATITQYSIPVKLVILKNTVLGLVRQYQHYNYKDRYSVIDLGAKPDLSMIAAAYGIDYLKLERSEDTDAILKSFPAEDKSTILEVKVDREELC